MNKGTLIFVILFFGAISAFLLWKAGNIYYDINHMKDWVSHEAKMLEVRFEEHEGGGDDADTYITIVSYQYKIDGKVYMENRVGFGYLQSNMDRHWQLYEKLKYARKVRVWIDPNDPDESVLVKGWTESSIFFILFTFVWVSGAIGAILWNINSNSTRLKTWARMLFSFTLIGAAIMIGRLALVNISDRYLVKLEDQVEVITFLNDQEIKREKLLEKAKQEAFRKAENGQDTIRIRLDGDTFFVK